jgi:hypothetical protein
MYSKFHAQDTAQCVSYYAAVLYTPDSIEYRACN